MRAVLSLTLFLLIPALLLSAEPLTKQEIASGLGSKPSYSKAEAVDLLYGMQTIYEEELAALEARLIVEEAARYAAYKSTFDMALAGKDKEKAAAETERTLLWVGGGVIGAGLTVYGIYRNDVGTAATGIFMAGAGAVRLIIALE